MNEADRSRDALAQGLLNWSQPVSDISPQGMAYEREASESERAALADAFGILAVRKAVAHLLLRPWRKSGFSVSGTVEAEVSQSCVVTLEPVVQSFVEEVDRRFFPQREAVRRKAGPDEAAEIVVDPLAEDPPEPFQGGAIDVGGVVAEHIALGLDPYPRAPGIEFEGDEAGVDDDGAPPSPFAGLKDMLTTNKGGTEGQ